MYCLYPLYINIIIYYTLFIIIYTWTRQLSEYCWGGFDRASNNEKILKYWNMQESKCLTGTVGQEEKDAVLKEISSLCFLTGRIKIWL